MSFDASLILEYWPVVLQGLPTTLKLTVVATLFGIFFGFLIAIVKINRVPVLRQICGVYVSFIRGVPLMVLLYMSYYGLPLITMAMNDRLGTHLDINSITPFTFALVAFVMQEAAYESEVIRAALAFIISVMDMMGKAKVLGGRNFHYFEAYICAALTYWVICILLGFAVKYAEKRMNVYDRTIDDAQIITAEEEAV